MNNCKKLISNSESLGFGKKVDFVPLNSFTNAKNDFKQTFTYPASANVFVGTATENRDLLQKISFTAANGDKMTLVFLL